VLLVPCCVSFFGWSQALESRELAVAEREAVVEVEQQSLKHLSDEKMRLSGTQALVQKAVVKARSEHQELTSKRQQLEVRVCERREKEMEHSGRDHEL